MFEVISAGFGVDEFLLCLLSFVFWWVVLCGVLMCMLFCFSLCGGMCLSDLGFMGSWLDCDVCLV
ncbi:hypothetical protein ACCT11_36355, partial [Rhizobium johnstonii]|uniref:hypothetical protein n=1 Tax=Rhizobium johnstonii TaxID=3019933 RepID=UPI003F99DD2A